MRTLPCRRGAASRGLLARGAACPEGPSCGVPRLPHALRSACALLKASSHLVCCSAPCSDLLLPAGWCAAAPPDHMSASAGWWACQTPALRRAAGLRDPARGGPERRARQCDAGVCALGGLRRRAPGLGRIQAAVPRAAGCHVSASVTAAVWCQALVPQTAGCRVSVPV